MLQVKINEGALYPTLNVVGSATKSFGASTSLTTLEQFVGSGAAQVSIPVYQGGSEYSAIRQAKETLSQRRVDLDTARDFEPGYIDSVTPPR